MRDQRWAGSHNPEPSRGYLISGAEHTQLLDAQRRRRRAGQYTPKITARDRARHPRRKSVRKLVAWAMVLVSTVGLAASQFELVGAGEPKLVLQLSWAALFFAGLDGLLIAHEGD